MERREHWALRASVGRVLQLLMGRGWLGQAAVLQVGHGGAGGVVGAHVLFVACSAVLEPDLCYFQDRTRLTERFKQLMEAGWTKHLDLCMHPDVSLLHRVSLNSHWPVWLSGWGPSALPASAGFERQGCCPERTEPASPACKQAEVNNSWLRALIWICLRKISPNDWQRTQNRQKLCQNSNLDDLGIVLLQFLHQDK